MHTTVKLINDRIKDAPQEVLDRLLGYIDALSDDFPNDIPKWQQVMVSERKKNKKEDYLSIESLENQIKLQK